MSNSFVTDIVIVSSKEKCPPGYQIVNVTTGGHNADLYEGSIGKRGERYLCFAKVPGSSTVISELNIVKEKDSVPTGFTGLKNCKNDASEKALRKHVFCLKTNPIQDAQSCVVDIVAVKQSKGESAPKNCFTITNDVNGLNICYQVLPAAAFLRQPPVPYPRHANMPYRPPTVHSSHPTHGAPYPNPSQNTPAGYRMPVSTTAHQSKVPPGNIARQYSVNKLASAIQGIQFQVNPKFEMMWKKTNLSEKPTRICSLDDIEKKYGYTFETEQNLLSSR